MRPLGGDGAVVRFAAWARARLRALRGDRPRALRGGGVLADAVRNLRAWHANLGGSADSAVTLDPELASRLLEKHPTEVFPGVRGSEQTLFDRLKCQHCGGVHARNCPAVAEIEYGDTGTPKRVVYWPHGTWPTDQVLWLDQVQEAAAKLREE
jgi:hypothetical protein